MKEFNPLVYWGTLAIKLQEENDKLRFENIMLKLE